MIVYCGPVLDVLAASLLRFYRSHLQSGRPALRYVVSVVQSPTLSVVHGERRRRPGDVDTWESAYWALHRCDKSHCDFTFLWRVVILIKDGEGELCLRGSNDLDLPFVVS